MADRNAAAERLRELVGEVLTGEARGAALADVETLEQLPELYGTAAAANVLGTTPANMQRWRNLPAPLYDLPAGRFYDAEAIREIAEQRREPREAPVPEADAAGGPGSRVERNATRRGAA